MKNMIVLKNLPSNLVEEAIIILKENNKIHKYQNVDFKEEKEENEEEKTGYIVKDAEMKKFNKVKFSIIFQHITWNYFNSNFLNLNRE